MLKRLLTDTMIQLLLVLVAGYFMTPYLSQHTIAVAYTGSVLIKAGLMLILPIITFTYIFSSMLKFARSSPWLILTVLFSLDLSNVLSISFAYFATKMAAPYFLTAGAVCLTKTLEIQELFNIPLPDFWSPTNGMLFGFIAGIIFSFVKTVKMTEFSDKLKDMISLVLGKMFIPVLPIFIFGFFVKMRFEGTIEALMAGYGKVLIFSVLLVVAYLGILLMIAHNFNIKTAIRHCKRAATPMLTAFTSMSSMAALPFTLVCTKEELQNDDFSDFIIPATVNMHMIGDGLIFGITISALVYLYSACPPSLVALGAFLFYYMLSKFSVAGVPGGSTAVTMPLLGTYLGFSEEMMVVFFTLGILQDCLITAANVGGNCIFAKLSYRLFGNLMKNTSENSRSV